MLLLPRVLRFVPANPLRRVLHRALSYGPTLLRSAVLRHIRITLQLKVRITFQNDAAVPEHDGDAVELDEAPLPPEPAEPVEDEVDMPAVQDIIEGLVEVMPAAPVPLIGSLYGIIGNP